MTGINERWPARRQMLGFLGAGVMIGIVAPGAWPLKAAAAALPSVTLYKSPYCGCCGLWAAYLRKHGFQVEVVKTEDMEPVKRKAGVPDELQTCHTAFIGDYVVEGHVPVPAIRRLLGERPKVLGIAVPGMPAGSPGMPSVDAEPYQVFAFAADGTQSVYMSF